MIDGFNKQFQTDDTQLGVILKVDLNTDLNLTKVSDFYFF